MKHRQGGKVRTIAIASAATCALAAAAWMIPQSAQASIASELGRTYIESNNGIGLVPLSANGGVQRKAGTSTTLGGASATTLTEAQQRAFEALAKKEIAARLGVTVPDGLSADISTTDDGSGNASVTVFLTGSSSTNSANASATYVAEFVNANLDAGTGSVASVMRRGDIQESEIAAYASKARKAFVDDLHVELPQGYPLDASLTMQAGKTGSKLLLQWYSHDPAAYAKDPLSGESIKTFVAGFENVNLKSGTGDLTQVERFRSIDSDDAAPTLTDAQQAQLEKAARAFASDKGIALGTLSSAQKVSGSYIPGVQFVFACSGRDGMTITVAADGTIQGYGFYVPKG